MTLSIKFRCPVVILLPGGRFSDNAWRNGVTVGHVQTSVALSGGRHLFLETILISEPFPRLALHLTISGISSNPLRQSGKRQISSGRRLPSPDRIQFAFPDDDYPPSKSLKTSLNGRVTTAVARYLLLPEVPVCLRNDIMTAALMPMPETAVDENHRMIFTQDYVWSPRQRPDIQTIAKSCGKERFPYHHFRPRVSAADMRHAPVSLFLCHPVRHADLFKLRLLRHKFRPIFEIRYNFTEIIISSSAFVVILSFRI